MKTMLIAAVLPVAAIAQDWQHVTDNDAIFDALANRTVIYDFYTQQHFAATGDTQYITERMSEGRWAARGGQYCSVWPPSDLWTCYDFYVSDGAVRFVSADRSVSEGSYKE